MESLLSKHHPRWIANYHEQETLLQENEEEKLTKEEQDMAWEVYRRILEWEEVGRVSLDEFGKPSVSNAVPSALGRANLATAKSAPERMPSVYVDPSAPSTSKAPSVCEAPSSDIQSSRGILRSRIIQRKCTNLSHLLTLRSQGTKNGCTTVCGECVQEISWEDLNKDGKVAR